MIQMRHLLIAIVMIALSTSCTKKVHVMEENGRVILVNMRESLKHADLTKGDTVIIRTTIHSHGDVNRMIYGLNVSGYDYSAGNETYYGVRADSTRYKVQTFYTKAVVLGIE